MRVEDRKLEVLVPSRPSWVRRERKEAQGKRKNEKGREKEKEREKDLTCVTPITKGKIKSEIMGLMAFNRLFDQILKPFYFYFGPNLFRFANLPPNLNFKILKISILPILV